jgi:hypothetical protein
MRYTKKIKLFIFITILFLITISSINFIIDPFQQYRQATFHKTIFMKGFYLNSGLIKSYNYNSVVIGSSMIQNFIIDEVNDKLKYENVIKLPISGGSIIEHYTVLNSAIKNRKIENVLFGLDVFSLKNATNRLPTYLYDNDILNDYLYLTSIDTLKRSILYPFLHYTIPKTHARLNYNKMFQWQHNISEADFNSTRVLGSFSNNDIDFNENINQEQLIKERIDNLAKYLIPLIKNNPNINYTFFYPPYSILTYKQMETSNTLDDFISTKKQIFKMMSKYQNIRIYDFQIAENITHDLNNYKDLTHYHQKINTWMLEQIYDINYLVNKNNIDEYSEKLKIQVTDYKVNNKN